MPSAPAVRCLLIDADRDLEARIAGICARLPGIDLVGCSPALRVLGAAAACDVMIVCFGGGRTARHRPGAAGGGG
jgi:hypothetical protein